jgi:hypothetical protein
MIKTNNNQNNYYSLEQRYEDELFDKWQQGQDIIGGGW